MNLQTRTLTRKPNHSFSHRNITIQFFQHIESQLLSYYPFFSQFYQNRPSTPLPFYSSIEALLASITFANPLKSLSTRLFRRTVTPQLINNPNSSFIEPLEKRQWKRFWLEPVSHTARNVWYRALHQKISCKAILHYTIPSSFPSPNCVFCSDTPDTITHFLYACPIKWTIWYTIWCDLFLFSPTFSQVHHAIFSLSFPSNPSAVSSHMIISCILQGLWSAHWRYVFDQVPFLHDNICRDIHFLITCTRPLISYEPP
ncbi:hypothetical protein BDB00DRAFT_844794 [Zychaea mexicana]|uniref:uncharacterized protein n=1 Tax=Zychaea mexicana TaxID=64656 RepID=UPI0022FDF03D|nr:uncharacterized protein BDB00DRAFT_844794 [Zychaea mexicana]KAI9489201.1 hypothetical protein BDB00DRAFT_844794 [Zychaea mexicana]